MTSTSNQIDSQVASLPAIPERRTLITQRATIKSSHTRFEKFLNDIHIQPQRIRELPARYEKFKESYQEFENIQSEIEQLQLDDTQEQEREQFEDRYFALDALARQLLETNLNTVKNTVREPVIHNKGQNIKLPQLAIPEFSGSYDTWPSFHDRFKSLIQGNLNLTKIEKFYYLQSALKGEASQVIQCLECTESNYDIAWNLLCERYQNKKGIIRAHIKNIVDLPNLSKETFSNIRQFSDEFLKNYRALQNLSEPVVHWDSILIYLLVSKLDAITRKEWETKISNTDSPTVSFFMTFLSERCKILEAIELNKNTHDKFNIKKVNTHTVTHHHCLFCKGDHLIYYCKDFLKLEPSARLRDIRRLRICVNCLRKGHNASDCTYSSCKICNKKHNSLLHLKKANEELVENTPHIPADRKDNRANDSTVSVHAQNREALVLLSTAKINIFDKHHNVVQCRALLDSGSQSSFMTSELFDKLKLSHNKVNVPVVGINGVTTSYISKLTHAKIESICSDFTTTIPFLVTTKITGTTPHCSFSIDSFEIPNSVSLADPQFNHSGKIDILLGANIFYSLLIGQQIKLSNSLSQLPILQNTKLGWIVAGPFTISNVQSTQTRCNLVHSDVQNALECFWKIEEVNKHENIYSKEERECEEHFRNTFTKHSSGRFIVRLPFKENLDKLGKSYDIAVKRLLSIERKFSKDTDLKLGYSRFMEEYLLLNHMSPISHQLVANQDENFFLPHHCVFKADSATTKLRVVYDASAKTTTNISLNDILMSGPNLQQDIFSILLRFRKHAVVFTADIEKMYRQILVHPDDRRFQQIVWRNETTEAVRCYQLKTITYGTTPASFLATRCLKQIALEYQENYPDASNVIQNDFYMDDLLSGADDFASALNLVNKIQIILSSAQLPLRQWQSNHPELLRSVNYSGNNLFIIKDNQTSSKTLGVYWLPQADVFQFSTRIIQTNKTLSKRILLSMISQIFDPLGLLGPVIIKMKILLQEIWKLKIDWDDELPFSIVSCWNSFHEQLSYLNEIKLQRPILLEKADSIQIHCFSDASAKAYGCCIYIVSKNSTSHISSHLACAKSRVAPIRNQTLTLPRLELCGAVLLAELFQSTQRSLASPANEVIFWCDSNIVLSWIKTEPSQLKTFVANRVANIQNLTSNYEWRHISSKLNPADLISRGLDPSQIHDSTLWWNGPSLLLQPKELWPHPKVHQTISELPELKGKTIANVANTVQFEILHRYSSYRKLLKIIAYIKRFKYNTLNKQHKTGVLSVEELELAERSAILLSQKMSFANELNVLQRTQTVPKNSKLMSLSPFLDPYGILRVGGRLEHSNLNFEAKHPMILAADNPLTVLIIREEHHKNLHAGTQLVLSSVRSRFWPMGGRRTVRKILRKCNTCFKINPTSLIKKMGDLPSLRVTSSSRPFITVGIDFAGHYLIKDTKLRNKKYIKSYVCIFVCFNTKAIHIELVSCLTTEGFLNALKRFVSRRGLCNHIFSDNAKNFIGANKHLQELFKLSRSKLIQNWSSEMKIQWHFIPPRSPHMGGLHEAAIKSAKYHIKRIIHSVYLTFEEFYTLLSQIECILNSRPILPLSEDPNDFEPLTPGHFIIGSAMNTLPELAVPDTTQVKVSRYNHLRLMLQHFWARWSHEYLNTLQQRTKWRFHDESPVHLVGAMVLLKEDHLPPTSWKLGRIIKIHPGKDGIVRVVSAKTALGETKRSITKVCLLPSDQP